MYYKERLEMDHICLTFTFVDHTCMAFTFIVHVKQKISILMNPHMVPLADTISIGWFGFRIQPGLFCKYAVP